MISSNEEIGVSSMRSVVVLALPQHMELVQELLVVGVLDAPTVAKSG